MKLADPGRAAPLLSSVALCPSLPVRLRPRTGRRQMAGALLCLAPLAAAAQPAAPPEMTLPPVVVTAPPVSAPRTVPDNEEAAAALRRMPGNVSLVPAEAFRDRPGVTTIRDMLEFTPGVFAQPKWGEDSRLSIRGSGLARNFHLRGVRLYQDGIPLNQADGSGDFQELDPLAFTRIEVLRGANAFPLGANSLGGAIRFVTPTGRDAPGALLRGEAGSHGFLRGQAAYGVAADAFDVWGSATGLYQDGFRRHSAGRSWRVHGNLGWRWSPDAETRLHLNYSNISQQIPGTVSRAQALRDPRQASPANVLNNFQRNLESFRLGSLTAFRPAEGVLLEFGGSFSRRELDHPVFQYIDNRSEDVALFGRATLEGSMLGLPNRLTAGVNAAIGFTDALRFLNLGGRPGRLTASSLDRARTTDLYVENSLSLLPGLALIAGAQLGEAYRASRDRFLADGDQSGAATYRWVNPRLGMLWEAAPGTQLFANLSWSTEPPTLSDLIPLAPRGGFSRLRAQRAATFEIGSRGERGEIAWEIAFYRAWIRDEIQLFSPAPGQTFALNAGRTLHQGLEAALDWTLRRGLLAEEDRLVLRQAYTFSDFRFDGDPTYGNNELPGAPRHLYRAELRYRHPAGAWAAPHLEWVPQAFYVDNANTLKTNSYAIFGLRTGWDFAGGLSVFLEARNLGNRRYIASASVVPQAVPNQALFEPGFGRSVFAGLQLRF
jgi:iron complex outermembrane receptor protein